MGAFHKRFMDVIKCNRCNKRAKSACTNQLCYSCCTQDQKNICPHHQEELIRKTEEDRYIEEALTKSNATNSRKKRLFRHEESKFTDFNQTVVIWCLKDFCQNRSMSASTFSHLERVKSSNAVKKKRLSGGGVKPAPKGNDTNRIRCLLMAKKRQRDAKYSRVKQKWSDCAMEQQANDNSTMWLLDKIAN